MNNPPPRRPPQSGSTRYERWGKTIRTPLPWGTVHRLCTAYERADANNPSTAVAVAARAAGIDIDEARLLLRRLGVQA